MKQQPRRPAQDFISQMLKWNPTAEAVGDSKAAAVSLSERARELLRRCPMYHEEDPLPPHEASYISFSARRDVFGPLCSTLPDPPPHLRSRVGSTPASVSERRNAARLRVVMRPSLGTSPAAPSPLSCSTTTSNDFSLAELVIFLHLYLQIQHDDDDLLLRLIGAVHHHFFSQELPIEAAPLPDLLYVLSSLGVSEERLIKLLTHSTNPPPSARGSEGHPPNANSFSAGTTAGSHPSSGLLYHQLPLYSERELLLLLVSLHRFGLDQQPAQKAVVKMLRRRLYQSNSDASTFRNVMARLKKKRERESISIKGTEGAAVVGNSGSSPASQSIASFLMASDALQPPLPAALRCPPRLLLDSLTALSLTAYRLPDVVVFLCDLIAITSIHSLAVLEKGDTADRKGGASENRIQIPLQLLRAAKLAEVMQLPQPLLSEVFSWSADTSGKGVYTDGGEDSDIPSNRVAYYDHVTADLIKANRV